jgi:SagB-type dehydrogenase family enzyme
LTIVPARVSGKKPARRAAPLAISARLSGDHITLETRADGNIIARFDGYSVGMGQFSAGIAASLAKLRTGLPLGSPAPDGSAVDTEIDRLIRRLSRSGLLEYRLGPPGQDQVVIEPQIADYWPRTPKLIDADTIVLSRFAYLRRRGHDMVLESPRAGALFRICDPKIAATLAALSTPQKISKLRRQDGFPGSELIALLVDCQILFKPGAANEGGLRFTEGDDHFVQWDFHDLMFHTRSTEGRQANPTGGIYPFADAVPSPPAVRPSWPGEKIDLRKLDRAPYEALSPFVELMRARHSTRDFDDQQPITLAELATFLDHTAQVKEKWKSQVDLGDGSGPVVAYTTRPYPSGGSSYELELYLAVANCEGLPRGFYHYDADDHALVPISARAPEFEAMLKSAVFAMDASSEPQVLITIAARFNRISWKYSAIAYALILKDVGVLIQTFYLMATDMGLGGCAIGSNNIDLFAKMTGIEFHIEGPVGQFALGRGTRPETSG